MQSKGPNEILNDVLVISCDETYNYNGKLLNGIDYAKSLRRSNETKPIVFTSFDSIENVLQRSHTNILTAIGHTFIQLPFTPLGWEDAISHFINDETNSLEALSDIQLKDIVLNFCGLRSSLSNSYHDFKGRLREIKGMNIVHDEKEARFQIEISEFRNKITKDYSEYPNLLSEMNRILNLFDSNEITSIDNILVYTEDSLVKHLPADEESNEESISNQKPWKILFLDDKPNELKEVFDLLLSPSRKISFSVVTTTDEAKKVIEKDFANQFAVVVSDYRLYRNDRKLSYDVMQKKQGYDFLIWLSEQNRFNGMVALSGLSKWFLMDSFRKKQINVKVYSKNNVLSGGAKAFIDDMEYLGNQNFEVLASQPQATNWKENTYVDKERTKIKSYALKPYYVYHRSHQDYETFESKINEQAERVAREIEYALDNSTNFNFTALVSIQGNATKTMKGVPEEEYSDFQMKLLQRRIFFYLLLKGFEPEAISKMLHKGDTEKEMSESMIKQVPSMLAIQTSSDLPYNILVEEKYFLQHYMNLPIYNIAEMMDQTHVLINAVLNWHLKGWTQFDELANYKVNSQGDLYQAVSIFDAHIFLQKITNILLNSKKEKVAFDLINDVSGILYSIKDLISNLPTYDKSLKKITELKERVAKKILK